MHPRAPGGTFRQLRLPGGDLVWVNVIKLRQFGQRLLPIQGIQGHFGFEGRGVVTAATLRYRLS